MKWALNTHVIDLRKKNLMVHFVESFREVKKNSVSLSRGVKSFSEVVKGSKELRFAASTLAKAVLEGSKNVVRVKEVQSGAVYNMF